MPILKLKKNRKRKNRVLGWHFLLDDGTRAMDGYRPAPGEMERCNGPLLICRHGFHASRRVYEALGYAEGTLLRRVELSGEIIESEGMMCATVRRELWRIDIKRILRDFARWVAYATVLGHWPDAPDIVRRWLATGDESISDEARGIAQYCAVRTPSTSAWAATYAVAKSTHPSALIAASDAISAAGTAALESTAGATSREVFQKIANTHLERLIFSAHRREKAMKKEDKEAEAIMV